MRAEIAAREFQRKQEEFNQKLMARLEKLDKLLPADAVKSRAKSAGKPAREKKRQQQHASERVRRNARMTAKAVLAAVDKAEEEQLDPQERAALSMGLETKGDAGDSDYEGDDGEDGDMPRQVLERASGRGEFDLSDDSDGDSTAGGSETNERKGADAADAFDLADYETYVDAITHDGQKATRWVHDMIPKGKGGHLHDRAMLPAQLFDKLNVIGVPKHPAIEAAKQLAVKAMIACWLAYEDDAWTPLDSLLVNPLVPLSHSARLRISRAEAQVQKLRKKKKPDFPRRRGGRGASSGNPSQQPRAASSANANANSGQGKQQARGAGGR